MKDIIKFLALGGQAENGKSNYCIEINDKIFIVDSGFRFPDSDKLGVDVIIPSFEYLVENKEKIAAIIITHGHDDVMASLPYLLRDIHDVPVYAPNLTADLIEEMIGRYERHNRVKLNMDLRRVKRDATIKIKGVEVAFFPVTHSIPGSVGVAFWTDAGYIVYASEFIIDFGAPLEFSCNLQKMMEIGKRGVLALLVESSYANRSGYTSPKHKLTDKIEHIFEDAKGRIIITSYAQNIFRTREIVELTKKYGRKIVFYGRDKYDPTNSILRLEKKSHKTGIKVDRKVLGKKENIGKFPRDNGYVILLSGRPQSIYSDIDDILDGGDDLLKIRKGDTFIVASPVLPGTEKIATRARNNLYRTEANVEILKSKELLSMHASEEDIKVVIQIFKPKYYIPIKGDYRAFVNNAMVARDMMIDEDNIIIADNGETLTFKGGELQSGRGKVEVNDVMIDGSGIGDVGAKVIDDRIQLSNDGVVVVGVTIDKKTKKIIAQTDCQTRGFVYLKDASYVIREVVNICEKAVATLENEPETDIQDIRNMMREQSMRYIVKETGKKPGFIGVVVEV